MYKFEGSFRLSSLACRDSPPTFGRPRPDRDYDSIRVGAGGRVEHWCQGGSAGLSVPAPFVWRCLTSPTVPERQHPLIEPDVRFARIRLSDHLHRKADARAVHGAVVGNR